LGDTAATIDPPASNIPDSCPLLFLGDQFSALLWVDPLAIPVADDFLLLRDPWRLTLPSINFTSGGDADSVAPDFLGLPMIVDV
jgi:hypothetical protein